MTTWKLLLATWPARILIGLSGIFCIAAVAAGFLLLHDGEAISEPPLYVGFDLPPLLYVFRYRLYLPDCELVFGRTALERSLAVTSFLANIGYAAWLIAMPAYVWRAIKYRPAPHHVFQHPGDTIGLPANPEVLEQQYISATVLPYPRRQTLFYVVLVLCFLVIYDAVIHSGFLIHEVCRSTQSVFPISVLMPAIQVGGFVLLEILIVEVISVIFRVQDH